METKEKVRWLFLTGVIIIGLVFLITPVSTVTAAPKYGGELRFAYGLEASSLDPHLGRSGGDAYYWRQIFDHIVGADAAYVSRPELSLAEKWEMAPDAKSWTFYLKEGIPWHDSKYGEVTAEVFDKYRLPTYHEASHKPFVIAAMMLMCRMKDPAAALL